MKLYTEADTETVVLPGGAMRELAASVIEYFLGSTLMSFAEVARSHNHMGWLLRPALMELLAWGMLPPSGAALQLPRGLLSNEKFWYSTFPISSLTFPFHLTVPTIIN